MDDYFKLRKVTPDQYKGFRLPAYFKAILPKDPQSRILEIGCGYGQILQGLKKAGYANLQGFEVSDEAIRYCASAGIAVTKSEDLIETCRASRIKFDFIIMSHVLEHFKKDAIIATLASVRQHLLNQGGALLVMVPNAQSSTGCYWAYEDFTHTTIFTSGSLYYVLKAAGFREVEFIDPDCLAGVPALNKAVRQLLLGIYALNLKFWNKVTSSSYHAPSPRIFSYEIKALARY